MARYLAFALLLTLVPAAQAADHCVILQYHHVSAATPGVTSVTPERFQEHLDYLKEKRFNVLPLERVVDDMQAGRVLPDRCVALTIDDAYISTYREAWPRARRYGFPLTVFVSTESVDLGLKSYLNWDQLREMSRSGVSIQNHSHSHDHLIRHHTGESREDWEQRVATGIQEAQNRIADEVGTRPTLFAYPYGEFTPELGRIVRSMGLVGFGQQSGPAWRDGDFAALPRFPMAANYASMKSFPTKISTLPLPVRASAPANPLVEPMQKRPTLELQFKPGTRGLHLLTCFANGSPDVDIEWPADRPGTALITPQHDIYPGRNRYNCTLPSGEQGRFHWYSHNWFKPHDDGSWYKEPY